LAVAYKKRCTEIIYAKIGILQQATLPAGGQITKKKISRFGTLQQATLPAGGQITKKKISRAPRSRWCTP
jgi:hypothetical protein